FDTFELRLKDAEGKEIWASGGRRVTTFTRPVLVPEKASYSICRKAELRWDPQSKTTQLFYWDGTGSEALYAPLGPGRYKLEFRYIVSPNPRSKAFLRPQRKAGDPPEWFGEVVTEQVVIEVHKR